MRSKEAETGTTQFSITLPDEIVAVLQQLVATKLYGNTRAEVARTLILNRLEQLAAQKLIKLPGFAPE
ncbi:MAG TPA: ribbon-helix-helix domain-containing protein [Beijerinckiaceae bacterium]